MMGKGMEGSQGRDTVRGGGLCFLNTMGEIPRGDLAQSLGGGWGHVLSSLPVVLGLSLWGLCLEILNKRGQRVPEEGATGWAGEATFFSCTKVNSMSVRLEISSSYLGGGEGGEGEAGTHTHTHRDCSAGCGGLGNGLLNPPGVGLGASAIPLVPCGS